jgi:transposase
MSKIDGRHLSEDTLQYLRRQAHELRKAGRTWSAIAEALGVSRRILIDWGKRFGVGGDEELGDVTSAKRGRTFGDHRTLDLAQETLLRDRIVQGSPAQLGLPYAMWSRAAVMQAVKVMWKIDMPIRTVGEYLRRWHFTPQRPARKALEQRPAQVQQWLRVEYLAIMRRAKAEEGVIYWADETAVRQDTAWVRGYALAGHTPVQEHATKRPKPSITMISALTNQGLLRFKFIEGGMNSDCFIGFMTDLVHDSKPKVFLIVDNLPAHKSHKVQDWLDKNKDRLELFYLPPYSPEMNPDEFINRDLKTELRMRPATNHSGTLKRIACDFMTTLRGMPQRLMGYFDNQHLLYASVEAGRCTI